MKRKLSRRPVLTRGICYAAGQDAGNWSMKAAGRTKWNWDDFNAAAGLCNKLLDKLLDEDLEENSLYEARKIIGGKA